MTGCGWCATAALVAGLAARSALPARASTVFLDEYWVPEIQQNEVQVTETDTEQTGDPTEAVAGYVSACLRNAKGAPSVRFAGASAMTPFVLPPGLTEARLWYRTDAWTGTWRLEVWLNSPNARRPVLALQADLDGGSEGGRLIADDRWHRAAGRLQAGAERNLLMQDDLPRACYVWLRPTDGWDIPHRTYVDRIEAVVVEGPLAADELPRPASRACAVPGAQTAGPGWIAWEAEDCLTEPGPPVPHFLPRNATAQRLLSGGAWVTLGLRTELAPLRYRISVPDAGSYGLWARGYWKQAKFRWRFDDGEWRTAGPGLAASQEAMLLGNWMPVGWVHLGAVELAAGDHAFVVEPLDAPLGLGFDVFVIARDAFVPRAGTGNGDIDG